MANNSASRSKAAKVIRTLLVRIRKLSCDRSGSCTRIRYVDKVFRDLYDVKNFARRSAACRRMSQVVQVFNEIGIKDLWRLLNDDTYYEVMGLLVDVQERKDELRKLIKKAQKKLSSSGGTLRIDQKSKQNRKINKAQDELKWLNKRYKDSIESLQENLNINPCGESYKDRFSALKRFSEQGSINNSWGYGYDDEYDYSSMSFGKQKDDFDDLDFDFDDDFSPKKKEEDRIDRLEKEISSLIGYIRGQNGIPNVQTPSVKNTLSGQNAPTDKNLVNVIVSMAKKIDEMDERLDDLEGYDEEPAPSMNPSMYDGGPSQEEVDQMFGLSPKSMTESGIYRPYDPGNPNYKPSSKTPSVSAEVSHKEEVPVSETKEESEPDLRPGDPVMAADVTPQVEAAKKHFRNPGGSDKYIDATNREEVRASPTSYQKTETPSE